MTYTHRLPYLKLESTVTLLMYDTIISTVRDANGNQTLPGGHPLVILDSQPMPFCVSYEFIDNRGIVELVLKLEAHDAESLLGMQAFIASLGSGL